MAGAKRGGGGGGRKLPLSAPATQSKVSAKDSNQTKTVFDGYFFQWTSYGIRWAAKGGQEGKDKRKSAKSEKTKSSVSFTTTIAIWTESLMVPLSLPLTLGARGFPVPRVLPTLRNQSGKLEHFSSKTLSTRIRIFLKYTSTRSVFESLARPHQNAKTMEIR